MIRTAICDLRGIRYPICQAGMGWVARSELAAAVSEAGGLFATMRAPGDESERFTDAVKGGMDVTVEERVPVVIAGLGNPGPFTAQAHAIGSTVMALCGNVKQARDHAKSGVDVVIAQGHEAFGHDNYKNKIVAIDEEGTVVTRAASGKPCRVIRNDFTREWDKRQAEIQPFPVQQGDIEHGSAACGQSAGLIHDVVSVREVIARIVDEAEATLARLPRQ